MPRPSTPQISKDEVFSTALAILDEQGIEGLTVRHLAERLNVRNGSLYYHFEGKDEILMGAARLALAEVGVPAERDEHWRSWLLRTAHAYRQRLIDHPALITVMLTQGRFNFSLEWFDEIAAFLADQGVAPPATLALLETLDEFIIGSVVAESAARRSSIDGDYPNLRAALRHRTLNHHDRFELACAQIIDGIAEEFGLVGTSA